MDSKKTITEACAMVAANLPPDMLAIEVPSPSGSGHLVAARRPIPVPAPEEVLIRVHAAGVNRGDIKQRHGDYPQLPPTATNVLGLEVSGVIERCGAAVDDWKVGDRVCALLVGGGYAEYCAAPAAQCLPVVATLGFIEAAALPETFATVWQTLFMKGSLQAGETVLIHGGSSGIGVAAIQLARAAGARVFATAGSPEKCRFCLSLGASMAIDYRREDFVERTLTATGGQGLNVVLDMVGGPYASRNVACLATDGRLVYVAGDGGGQVSFAIRDIMIKRLSITGATLRHRSVALKGRILAELRDFAWPLLEAGRIKPVIDRVFDLRNANEAHAHLEAGSVMGKVILRVR